MLTGALPTLNSEPARQCERPSPRRQSQGPGTEPSGRQVNDPTEHGTPQSPRRVWTLAFPGARSRRFRRAGSGDKRAWSTSKQPADERQPGGGVSAPGGTRAPHSAAGLAHTTSGHSTAGSNPDHSAHPVFPVVSQVTSCNHPRGSPPSHTSKAPRLLPLHPGNSRSKSGAPGLMWGQGPNPRRSS